MKSLFGAGLAPDTSSYAAQGEAHSSIELLHRRVIIATKLEPELQFGAP